MLEELRFKIRRFFNKDKERKAWDSHDLNGLEENAPWWMDDREIELYKFLNFCHGHNIDIDTRSNELQSLKLYKEQHPKHFEKLSQYLSDKILAEV